MDSDADPVHREPPLRRPKTYFRKPPHPDQHPLIKQLDQIVAAGHTNPKEICDRAGVDRDWLYRRRRGASLPNIGNFDAVLNVLGYRLAIVRKTAY
jgi:DNA-binding phage protein